MYVSLVKYAIWGALQLWYILQNWFLDPEHPSSFLHPACVRRTLVPPRPLTSWIGTESPWPKVLDRKHLSESYWRVGFTVATLTQRWRNAGRIRHVNNFFWSPRLPGHTLAQSPFKFRPDRPTGGRAICRNVGQPVIKAAKIVPITDYDYKLTQNISHNIQPPMNPYKVVLYTKKTLPHCTIST